MAINHKKPIHVLHGNKCFHCADVIMDATASQTTGLIIVYSTSGEDPGKHQSSASLAFVRGIHRGPVNSPHKWPVTRKMFPFDVVIMNYRYPCYRNFARRTLKGSRESGVFRTIALPIVSWIRAYNVVMDLMPQTTYGFPYHVRADLHVLECCKSV